MDWTGGDEIFDFAGSSSQRVGLMPDFLWSLPIHHRPFMKSKAAIKCRTLLHLGKQRPNESYRIPAVFAKAGTIEANASLDAAIFGPAKKFLGFSAA